MLICLKWQQSGSSIASGFEIKILYDKTFANKKEKSVHLIPNRIVNNLIIFRWKLFANLF